MSSSEPVTSVWDYIKDNYRVILTRSMMMAVTIGVLAWYTNSQIEESQNNLVAQHHILQEDFANKKKELQEFVEKRDELLHQDVTAQFQMMQARKLVYSKDITNQVSSSQAKIADNEVEKNEHLDASILNAVNDARKESQP